MLAVEVVLDIVDVVVPAAVVVEEVIHSISDIVWLIDLQRKTESSKLKYIAIVFLVAILIF